MLIDSLVALALIAVSEPLKYQSEARITGIEVRFFEPGKASFTENVLDQASRFSGWNTFLGEGNGGYGRGDALVLVRLEQTDLAREAEVKGTLTI